MFSGCFYLIFLRLSFFLFLLYLLPVRINAQDTAQVRILDEKVRLFLEANKENWHNANVPASDGKILYDVILKHGYTRALEIGTSTGHSAIWIAWALTKTGGNLVTIEINENRYEKAVLNFESVGLSDYIDARHADAHELIKELDGPFDFVFCDADKDWYENYFRNLWPKVEKEGCFAAHNVLNTYFSGIPEFLEYVQNFSGVKTKIIHSSSSGISLSYKH
jgi:caffeoyl-CoA O-methyltransferase